MGDGDEASKEDIAKQLRELLGLEDVKFEKLSKQELVVLQKRLGNMVQLIQVAFKGKVQELQGKVLNRPLKQVLGDETLFGKDGLFGLGILGGERGLGLGILPALRANLGGEKKAEKPAPE